MPYNQSGTWISVNPQSGDSVEYQYTVYLEPLEEGGAAITMKVGDYFQHRKRWWLRLA